MQSMAPESSVHQPADSDRDYRPYNTVNLDSETNRGPLRKTFKFATYCNLTPH
jgi:hypothetical protein